MDELNGVQPKAKMVAAEASVSADTESTATETQTADQSKTEKYALSVDKNGKKTDNKLWDFLSKQEQALLYQNVNQLRLQKYSKRELPNGNYLFSVNNKIIESDGKLGTPSIECVVEINNGTQNYQWEDIFYDYVDNEHSVEECVQFSNRMFKKEVAVYYGIESSRQDSGRREQGSNDSENRRSSERGNVGTGLSGEIKNALSEAESTTESKSKHLYKRKI